eukprot:gene10130-biopygen15457
MKSKLLILREAKRGIGMILGKQAIKVWKGWGAAVSDEMLSHGVGGGCIRHLAGSGNVKWVKRGIGFFDSSSISVANTLLVT